MSINNTPHQSHGFTLVEVLIIAPIVILAIGTFVAAMVNMTGDVLRTREENSIVYNTQDALNTIEQDIVMSGAFLAGNEIAAPSPQGINNSTGAVNSFTNVGSNGTMLILRSLTTDKNPLDGARQPIYTDQPNGCAQKTSNKLFTDNVIYFVKSGTLWRRTILQQGNGTPTLCNTPWQQPSCAVGIAKGTACKINDTKLLDNVTAFTISYKSNPNDSDTNSLNTAATDTTATVDTRNQTLLTATAAKVTLTSGKTVAGQAISHTGYLQASKINITQDAPTVVPLAISQQPSDQSVAWTAANATFSVGSSYTGSTYQWQRSTDGGSSWTNIAGATGSTLTITPINMSLNGYQYRAVVTNSGTSVNSDAATLTVYIWQPIPSFNANWSNFSTPYAFHGYTKTPSGFVMLKGLIKRSGSITSGEVIGTLPVGYRPSARLIFQTSTSNAGHFARVDVDTTGSILAIAGDPGFLSLEGINFMPSGTTFTPLTLTNSWVFFGSPYATPAYAVDGAGRTHIQGLVGGGNVADNVQIVNNLPASARTGQYLHVPDFTSGPGPGYVGIDPTNGVVAKGAGNGNGWMNINAMFHPASASASWINLGLMNGWTTLGGFSTPQYIKGSDNVVMVKGLISSGTVNDGTVVGCLPAGYRPKDRILIQGGITNAKAVRWDIRQTDGCIEIYYGDAGWASLDAISFVAEQ
jgi:hypothetical protein